MPIHLRNRTLSLTGVSGGSNLKERVTRLPDGAATFRGYLPIGPFLRTLAKVGHALAVAERGIDYFKPFLTEYILTGKGLAAL